MDHLSFILLPDHLREAAEASCYGLHCIWMKQQAGKQANTVGACRCSTIKIHIVQLMHLQWCSCDGSQLLYMHMCDEMRILMMLHQQTLTHHPTPKSERRMNQLAGTNWVLLLLFFTFSLPSLLTCVFIAVKYLSMQGLACRLAAFACSRQQPWPMIYIWKE